MSVITGVSIDSVIIHRVDLLAFQAETSSTFAATVSFSAFAIVFGIKDTCPANDDLPISTLRKFTPIALTHLKFTHRARFNKPTRTLIAKVVVADLAIGV
jgi:hypothetical protein